MYPFLVLKVDCPWPLPKPSKSGGTSLICSAREARGPARTVVPALRVAEFIESC